MFTEIWASSPLATAAKVLKSEIKTELPTGWVKTEYGKAHTVKAEYEENSTVAQAFQECITVLMMRVVKTKTRANSSMGVWRFEKDTLSKYNY